MSMLAWPEEAQCEVSSEIFKIMVGEKAQPVTNRLANKWRSGRESVRSGRSGYALFVDAVSMASVNETAWYASS
jgi:hypothetical protein